MDWFDHRRLLAWIGNIPPAEVEAKYFDMLDDIPLAAYSNQIVSGNAGAVQFGNVRLLHTRPLIAALEHQSILKPIRT